VLDSIKSSDLGAMKCADIKSHDITEFARELSVTRAPATVANYLSHRAAIFAIARLAWGYELDEQVMADAVKVAKRPGLAGKSQQRERRPSLEELDHLMSFFVEPKRGPVAPIPMQLIVAFALFSTRRQEEITRIKWQFIDGERKKVQLITDMKHPGEKRGNDVWCHLPDPAYELLHRMPKIADEIFPYDHRSISAPFTRACKVRGIENSHFHDLQHEGVSRLFEMGLDIPRVADVSGHRSWEALKRYKHLERNGDKYAGWKSLEPMRSRCHVHRDNNGQDCWFGALTERRSRRMHGVKIAS
jgi:integrase